MIGRSREWFPEFSELTAMTIDLKALKKIIAGLEIDEKLVNIDTSKLTPEVKKDFEKRLVYIRQELEMNRNEERNMLRVFQKKIQEAMANSSEKRYFEWQDDQTKLEERMKNAIPPRVKKEKVEEPFPDPEKFLES